ncbi:hypothetical protein HQ346_20650 [Rhodococcus sp. BP-252]|uniref:hypothetical protein n=1 Tax=unclassified Rhodococcus (in: high G+C Gram-positive bacteria) TaxID=192944 RepID=UPI001C9B2775|nr:MULTISPECIES: hypothetical protein [unclassified Rhodococcus (in: high G+C Gram-positive bacteria)]MBY6414108.1 hypothetical protein [Rhodococcus sp. BP-320]MBY6418917.1 hypothetical protein [Rhodococcus sp. BP-321]MBY6423614.1 hypothetical protein [Rhodococcus sp. BP-324]MBY6428951.1 hypothetical protein [Rhodococcus sp. BP-323]MBY6433956.1 hypothetical protein [Rhodococcus sp. BP-322]
MTDEVVAPLEADPASLRTVGQDMRLDADAMAAAAVSVTVDGECVSGSMTAAVLAQIHPVVSASIESASTRLLQFADDVVLSAEGYEQADREFAEALKRLVSGAPQGPGT